jgi:hypothetical protein
MSLHCELCPISLRKETESTKLTLRKLGLEIDLDSFLPVQPRSSPTVSLYSKVRRTRHNSQAEAIIANLCCYAR